MNIADVIVLISLFMILGIIVYVTRPKKGKDDGNPCDSNCSSCHLFSNLYDEYKQDQKKK